MATDGSSDFDAIVEDEINKGPQSGAGAVMRRGGKTPGKGKLTIQQKAFADEYLLHGNAALAAERAGFGFTKDERQPGQAKRSFNSIGQKLIAHPAVRRYVTECQVRVTSRTIASRKERLEILSDIIRGTVDARPDQVSAAKLMAQMEGELVHRVGGPAGGPIEINAMSTHELLAIIARFK